MSKCETCMEKISADQRQLTGCGYLPRADERLLPMVRGWGGLGYKGDTPTTCPGYTTALPEVIEIARAHFWRADLSSFTGDEPATDVLLIGVEILAGAIAECESWRMTPKKDGGGGS